MISASMVVELANDFEEEKAYKFAFEECWKEIEKQEKVLSDKNDPDAPWVREPKGKGVMKE